MGLTASKLFNSVFRFTRPTRVLMLGLDAAGKTTALYKLKMGELVTTIPTIGFNVEAVRHKNLEMTIWDVGGQDKIRTLWRHYYDNTDALVFLVDSNDPDRLQEAREELHEVLADDRLRNACVLLLANKQDLPRAMAPHHIAEQMGMRSLRQEWYIQPCSAVTGSGLYEGLDWLSTALRGKDRASPAA
ncbi:hypothetical protein AB1Y20_005362 [Prymnesium parvum]|uniref:ADP-ribosylation factor n=1 Tax=Prymnesium parvum TaxID=97485 RepID=A0AB34J610_PRYPA